LGETPCFKYVGRYIREALSKMKILLINPPQRTKCPQPPLGLAMVAAVLEKNTDSVQILDLTVLGISNESLRLRIQQEKPDIVGITAMTPTINSALRVAKNVKEVDKEIIVILGGAHATLLPGETLHDSPDIDLIVCGEGEQTTPEVIATLKEDAGSLRQVPGVAYREGSETRINPLRPPILDLDSLPFPAFHLLPMGKYRLHPPFGRKTPIMPIITSRGCPYRCVFCSKSVFGHRYRSNSAVYVANQIQFLIEKFGIREVKFYDDSFTLNKKRVIDICTLLKQQQLDIPWTCETRVDLVDRDLLKIMMDAGCYMIEYGVESGNQLILDNLKKDTTLDQTVKTFKWTHEAGIETVAYFMIGSPGETLESIRESIEFAKKLDPDFVQFSVATPYPGTELYRMSLEEGCMPGQWDRYVYADLKPVDNPVFGTKNLNKEELRKWNKRAYTSFYLRRSYALKRLARMTTSGELRTNVAGLRMLIDLVK